MRKMTFKLLILVIVVFFLGIDVGRYETERRQEKMAKETGTIFIKSQPYKISPIKKMKAN